MIIPCLNEEKFLGSTLRGIKRHLPDDAVAEIIVVDHGSSDRSADIARANGATVIHAPGVPLGTLRNIGARAAEGEVLIYLDADIALTEAWSKNIHAAVEALHRDRPILLGSMAEPEPQASWVSQEWERGRATRGPIQALGAAHMIVRQDHFWAVGGFPSEMDAGEDDGLCRRIWENGGSVIANPDLRVLHRGCPDGIVEFFRRQVWHGTSEARSLELTRRSRTAKATLLFVGLYTIGIASLLAASVSLAILTALAATAIPVAAALRRRLADAGAKLVPLSFLYWLYFLARSLSFIVVIGGIRPGRGRSDTANGAQLPRSIPPLVEAPSTSHDRASRPGASLASDVEA